MDLQNFSMSKKPSHIYIFFIIFTSLANYILSLDPKFLACRSFTCGDGQYIRYPFWVPNEQQSFCGHPNFKMICKDKNPVLTIANDDYIVKDIFYSNQTFLVANAAVYEDTCPAPLHNISLDQIPFSFSLDHSDFSIFYNCTSKPNYPTFGLDCASNSTRHSFAVFHKEALKLHNYSWEECHSLVDVPVDMQSGVNFTSLLLMNYSEILKMGFFLNWTAHDCSSCERSSGRCGFENNEFVCFCHDRPHLKTCDDGNSEGNFLISIVSSSFSYVSSRHGL
ncbi:LEAF RUST 10 DISEASE-RESISTANCE LOCUS RECEPTOR-LIKE PROTEIN KINASE-like 1.2 [Fagus crenata]